MEDTYSIVFYFRNGDNVVNNKLSMEATIEYAKSAGVNGVVDKSNNKITLYPAHTIEKIVINKSLYG